MCKHHWMLGTTTLDGTPATCKLCGEEHVFYARSLSWETATERRKPSHIQPSCLTRAELPFNAHGYMGGLKGIGNRTL